MKRSLWSGFGIWDLGFLLAVSLCGCSVLPGGASKGSVVVSYWDLRGGDAPEPPYDTRFSVSVDGVPAGESPVADRYDRKTMTLNLTPGTHRLVIEGLAFKNGAWEKRTAANGYLFDHRMEKTVEVKPGASAAVNFCVPDRREKLTIRI